MPAAAREPRFFHKEFIDGDNLQRLCDYIESHSEMFEHGKAHQFARHVHKIREQAEYQDGSCYLKVQYFQLPFGGRRYVAGARLWDDDDDAPANGRVGIQNMWAPLRQYLLGFQYHDIDIVNCIPSIIAQVAEHSNAPARKLIIEYVRDKDVLLSKICEQHKCCRHQAKNVIIRLYNQGGYEKWCRDNNLRYEPLDFLVNFQDEMKTLSHYVNGLPQYAAVRAYCHSIKASEEAHRATFANAMFLEESIILDTIVNAFRELGFSANGLVFDGTCIRDRQGLASALPLVEDKVLSATGFKISLAEKPMYGMNKMALEDLIAQCVR